MFMKPLRIYELFAENTLPKIFLSVNLITSVVIFDWGKFFAYLSKTGESGCKPIPAKLSFGIYDMAGNTFLESILAAAAVFFSVFYLPAYAATLAVIGAMKRDYPQWCIETFDVIFIPIFSVLNCVYLIFLSCLIRWLHDYHTEHKSVRKNLLSIYPK